MTDILNPAHPDLIAHWTMGNISGTTLIDETGNYSGAITGATAAQWEYGSALNFDGSADRVIFSPRVNVTASFTISTFVALRNVGKIGGHWIINSRSDTRSGTEWQLVYYVSDGFSTGLSFSVWNTAGAFFVCDSGVVPLSGRVYHVASTVAPGVISIYIDGVLKNQIGYSGTLRTSSQRTTIGRRDWYANNSGTVDGDMDGMLGVTRIYTGARTQDEIIDLLYEPVPYEVAGVVAVDGQPISTDVRIYRAETGDLLATVTSDANGDYQQPLLNADPVYVMPVPPAGYRPLVHGPINPALRNR